MHREISDRDFMAGIAAVTEFAWSAPMRDLAARVGISDVGLKKLLHAQGMRSTTVGVSKGIRLLLSDDPKNSLLGAQMNQHWAR